MSSLTLRTLVLICPGVCIQDFLITVFMMFMSHSIHPVKKRIVPVKLVEVGVPNYVTIPSLLQLTPEDLAINIIYIPPRPCILGNRWGITTIYSLPQAVILPCVLECTGQ